MIWFLQLQHTSYISHKTMLSSLPLHFLGQLSAPARKEKPIETNLPKTFCFLLLAKVPFCQLHGTTNNATQHQSGG